MQTIIYHNPKCGTSRNVLSMIRASGEEPEIIEYLKDPPSRERLSELWAQAGLTIREGLRKKGTPYAELGLDNPKWTDDELFAFIAEHPILIQRPLVVNERGTRLCRPSEQVLPLLKQPLTEPFVKEDGEVVQPQPAQPE